MDWATPTTTKLQTVENASRLRMKALLQDQVRHLGQGLLHLRGLVLNHQDLAHHLLDLALSLQDPVHRLDLGPFLQDPVHHLDLGPFLQDLVHHLDLVQYLQQLGGHRHRHSHRRQEEGKEMVVIVGVQQRNAAPMRIAVNVSAMCVTGSVSEEHDKSAMSFENTFSGAIYSKEGFESTIRM